MVVKSYDLMYLLAETIVKMLNLKTLSMKWKKNKPTDEAT